MVVSETTPLKMLLAKARDHHCIFPLTLPFLVPSLSAYPSAHAFGRKGH